MCDRQEHEATRGDRETRVIIHRRKRDTTVSPDSPPSFGTLTGPFVPRRSQLEVPCRRESPLVIVVRSLEVGAAVGSLGRTRI